MEIEEQLRSTSDQMLETIEQLRSVEAEKRTVAPDSRQFQKLAREVERLADTVIEHAETQTDLGAEAAEQAAVTGQVVAPINSTPRDVNAILGDWREAERRAAAAEAGSEEAAKARADVDRFRAEYQRAQRVSGRRSKES